MSGPSLLERLQQQFGEGINAAKLDALDPWIEVASSALVDVCTWLRDQPDLRFNMLNCISGVDYFEADPKKAAKTGWEPHLEVVYHLSSLVNKTSLVLKVNLPRWDEAAGDRLPTIPSVASVWRTADWHEREVFDLVGVRFEGHPNLRRILCPEDWVGHPLRRDYEMPLEYHGIRGK